MKKQRQRLHRAPRGLLILASLPACSLAFVANVSPIPSFRKTNILPMMISETSAFDPLTNVKQILEHSYTTAYDLCSSGASSLFCLNENLAAEIFGDLSHLALDFATFLSPDTTSLRLLLFLGRIFSIASDYIPDHKMTAEEGLFQFAMLAYSSKQLIKSALPRVPLLQQHTYANEHPTLAFKYRRLYLKSFYCAGFSYSQYQVLLVSGALRWISLPPNTNMTLGQEEESDAMYLLHRGPVYHIMNQDKILYDASSTSRVNINLICGFISARRLIDDGIVNDRRASSNRAPRSFAHDPNTSYSPSSILQAGADGAMLLEMNIPRVLEIMKDDDEISKSMKRLVFIGLQEKIFTAATSD